MGPQTRSTSSPIPVWIWAFFGSTSRSTSPPLPFGGTPSPGASCVAVGYGRHTENGMTSRGAKYRSPVSRGVGEKAAVSAPASKAMAPPCSGCEPLRMRAHTPLAAFEQFVQTPLSVRLDPSSNGDAEALAHFRQTAQTVPAYREFLREHGVDAASVQTISDFRRLPRVTRDNYLRRFPLADRCRNGDLSACDMIAVSSGSTGEPTFWPRTRSDEYLVAARFEQIFSDAFAADRKRTLAVICFPLGTWVGGMFTTSLCQHLANRGYPLTTVTPGNHRGEIFRAVRALSPMFEQTVLLGYPPFLKDVVDVGIAEKVPWSQYGIKLVFAGEVFSEAWRSIMAERTGMTHVILDSASLYGTADAGVLGNETPISIAIRRFLSDRIGDAAALFGSTRLPTLVQYDPRARYFEEHDGTLVFSADNGVPLVRYHLADDGGVVPYAEMIARMRALGFDAEGEARRAGTSAIRELPFVYVFGRSHFAISYYGANIFPETISLGLEHANVRAHVTGKFVMEARETGDHDRKLEIAVELAPGAIQSGPPESLAQEIASAIVFELRRTNSEFTNYVPEARQPPTIRLFPVGDPEYFPLGVKHRYSR